ncbi:MAG TPA: Flp pilus assembly protein CpaB [Methylibium sp.]|uniref:Flp pilus assembly protein CpaB n=1 Tax=Methylibium sp. TaxID=2067992 RepID=UPI002DBD74DC|nr:Flp pilus assembly protein CpaB [Methylibium sp.]HEU4458271.1 Flp pilus assembly protein CpaB [Methylibium sp.]
MKRLRLPPNLLIPLIAILVGAIAAIAANRYIHQRIEAAKPKTDPDGMVPLVVATADLSKGDRLASNNLAVRQVPKLWVHANAIRPEDFGKIEHAVLAVPAAKGQPVLWAQLEGQRAASFSARLANGRRAVTVAVDEISSISGMLSPGDTIDLIAMTKVDQRSTLVPVMQAVRVLATGTRVDNGSPEGRGERSFTTVTLDVTPDEARRIMAAREVGRLTALLRAPGDVQAALAVRSDAMAELGLAPPGSRAGAAPTVAVMHGAANPRLYTVRGGGGYPANLANPGESPNELQLSASIAPSTRGLAERKP